MSYRKCVGSKAGLPALFLCLTALFLFYASPSLAAVAVGDQCNTSVNLGECNASVRKLASGESRNIRCRGTYGYCNANVSCSDGQSNVSDAECAQPRNCSGNRNLKECRLSYSLKHGQTSTLECEGRYGACSTQVRCDNGRLFTEQAIACTPPAACDPTLMPLPESQCSASTIQTEHRSSSFASCEGPKGQCGGMVRCTDGQLELRAETCSAGASIPETEKEKTAQNTDAPDVQCNALLQDVVSKSASINADSGNCATARHNWVIQHANLARCIHDAVIEGNHSDTPEVRDAKARLAKVMQSVAPLCVASQSTPNPVVYDDVDSLVKILNSSLTDEVDDDPVQQMIRELEAKEAEIQEFISLNSDDLPRKELALIERASNNVTRQITILMNLVERGKSISASRLRGAQRVMDQSDKAVTAARELIETEIAEQQANFDNVTNNILAGGNIQDADFGLRGETEDGTEYSFEQNPDGTTRYLFKDKDGTSSYVATDVDGNSYFFTSNADGVSQFFVTDASGQGYNFESQIRYDRKTFERLTRGGYQTYLDARQKAFTFLVSYHNDLSERDVFSLLRILDRYEAYDERSPRWRTNDRTTLSAANAILGMVHKLDFYVRYGNKINNRTASRLGSLKIDLENGTASIAGVTRRQRDENGDILPTPADLGLNLGNITDAVEKAESQANNDRRPRGTTGTFDNITVTTGTSARVGGKRAGTIKTGKVEIDPETAPAFSVGETDAIMKQFNVDTAMAFELGQINLKERQGQGYASLLAAEMLAYEFLSSHEGVDDALLQPVQRALYYSERLTEARRQNSSYATGRAKALLDAVHRSVRNIENAALTGTTNSRQLDSGSSTFQMGNTTVVVDTRADSFSIDGMGTVTMGEIENSGVTLGQMQTFMPSAGQSTANLNFSSVVQDTLANAQAGEVGYGVGVSSDGAVTVAVGSVFGAIVTEAKTDNLSSEQINSAIESALQNAAENRLAADEPPAR